VIRLLHEGPPRAGLFRGRRSDGVSSPSLARRERARGERASLRADPDFPPPTRISKAKATRGKSSKAGIAELLDGVVSRVPTPKWVTAGKRPAPLPARLARRTSSGFASRRSWFDSLAGHHSPPLKHQHVEVRHHGGRGRSPEGHRSKAGRGEPQDPSRIKVERGVSIAADGVGAPSSRTRMASVNGPRNRIPYSVPYRLLTESLGVGIFFSGNNGRSGGI
jgi:hypothetical protein